MGNLAVLFTDRKDANGNSDGIITTELTATSDSPSEVLQRKFYYSYGMAMEGAWATCDNTSTCSASRYQYNGKEQIDDLGLDWYNYGARYADMAIGRFVSVDALADELVQIDKSPYAYAWDNPIGLTDPDGNCPFCPLLLKGISGAAIDYALQGALNYASGMSLQAAFSPSNIDKSDVLLSGLQGALPWSVPGGKYSQAVAAALADVAFNYGKATLNGADYSTEQAGADFLVGFVAQLGAEKAAEFFGGSLKSMTNFSESKSKFAAHQIDGTAASKLIGAGTPRAYLDKALSRQGLSKPLNKLKEPWIEDGYEYIVRIHGPEAKYGHTGNVYRVSRQVVPSGNPKAQGSGLEYMDIHGNWHHERTLKQFYKGGGTNPNYNEQAARETHISVPQY